MKHLKQDIYAFAIGLVLAYIVMVIGWPLVFGLATVWALARWA